MFNPLFLPLALLLNYCAPASDTPTMLAATAATGPGISSGSVPLTSRLAYDFSRPAATYPMPAELAELSGIVLSRDGQLTGVQDEAGRLYEYSLADKRVTNTVDFGPAGDYEDLARVGDDWFILRSDGTLFRYSATGTKQYQTGLTIDNNAEGLTYDARSKTLLVACKGTPGGDLTATKRAVYRLDPTTYKVQTPAAYVLDVDAIVAAVPQPAAPEATTKGKKGKKGAGGFKSFAPSAVAVHPLTGHVFVLSARQNALVELADNGELLAVATLPENLFPQAEGLAFTPAGDLYIATEAGKKSGQALVHLFRQQR
ncbi:SdiA-regulated domain-containing protein [Hymenobacter sp. ISL-91]|uniref:SdiA-regulated domain-containing protein n=1 Tax=Hymenobacter sp. ISL-91 TaxID=2819151 RepID=UPI001BE86AFA|nr:SdiA-regulated domain-containing protein [Hymenobacter sp. ISL-91]MBT2557874.1 SdiA-regulated domain-containing protein [Hymenobacter sp. ISL-91]